MTVSGRRELSQASAVPPSHRLCPHDLQGASQIPSEPPALDGLTLGSCPTTEHGLGRHTRALGQPAEASGVAPSSARPNPGSRKAHLQSNVRGLVPHGHPGDAGEVDQGQIWDLRGRDLQGDELVADANSSPSDDVLGYGGRERRKPRSKLTTHSRHSGCS